MFIFLPTSDSHAAVAAISIGLLRRYWPDHPPVHVLHYGVRPRIEDSRRIELHGCGPQAESGWLQTMTRFLNGRTEESFILMLDDYALCGPARADLIASGAQLMREDTSVGLFPLCWYPAAGREPRPGHPGIVTLTGTPILLQAGIWRRSWFLELAREMSPRTSPWGFEMAATQVAKRLGRDICAADIPEPRYVGGHLVDGFVKTDWPLPYHNLMHGGRPEEAYEAFLYAHGFEFPSCGAGDTVAKIVRLTGLATLFHGVSQLTGRDCGCDKRRRDLNQIFPYPLSSKK